MILTTRAESYETGVKCRMGERRSNGENWKAVALVKDVRRVIGVEHV